MICSNCNGVNDKSNKYCSLCGQELVANINIVNEKEENNDDYIYRMIRKERLRVIKIVCFSLLPLFIIGILCTGISLFDYIMDESKYKGYVETNGYFVGYEDCSINEYKGRKETLCYEKYEYKVDGKEYSYITEQRYNKNKDENIQIRKQISYDPKEPSKCGIKQFIQFYLVIGLFTLGLSIIVLLLANIISKKLIEKRYINEF